MPPKLNIFELYPYLGLHNQLYITKNLDQLLFFIILYCAKNNFIEKINDCGQCTCNSFAIVILLIVLLLLTLLVTIILIMHIQFEQKLG